MRLGIGGVVDDDCDEGMLLRHGCLILLRACLGSSSGIRTFPSRHAHALTHKTRSSTRMVRLNTQYQGPKVHQ